MLEIQEHVCLRPYNSFQIAVNSRYFCTINSQAELLELIPQLPNFPNYLLLGGGSNLLLCDDFDGLVIHLAIAECALQPLPNEQMLLRLGAGENWHHAVRFSVEQQLFGLENLSLIPGSAGAAPVQNIGAYGVELKDVLHAVEVVDLVSGELQRLVPQECDFGYRHSIFKTERGKPLCVTAIELMLSRKRNLITGYGEVAAEINQQQLDVATMSSLQMSDVIVTIRQRKLPDPAQLPNAGSFFKNPVVSAEQYQQLKQGYPNLVSYALPDNQYKLACGWMIDQLGWKGRELNGAKVHDQQALVLINSGGGAAAIMALAKAIAESVWEVFQVHIEPEPVWVGEAWKVL